ncbi:MAG TPA: trypsin-like peptidase domain-containing protein [Nocardioides sp.]|uniref:S1C family serine protease n=1 Tax=Nocardioides sp. TaxID=35761 RepID=UPI002D806A10|nr:trypsin-like peptidase domain-containing protein [Nocardioides sp.]HET6652971.1 trypsin-like peptidase domain-containing protein [Nocardioides sp.]
MSQFDDREPVAPDDPRASVGADPGDWPDGSTDPAGTGETRDTIDFGRRAGASGEGSHPDDPDDSGGSDDADGWGDTQGWDDTQPIGSGTAPAYPGSDELTGAQPEWPHEQPDPAPWPQPEAPGSTAWPTAAYTAGYRQEPGPHPYDQYGQPGYAGGPPRQTSGSGQPGWFWPVVAATALVVGLLGGTLAAVAVSSSMTDGSVNIPIIQSDDRAAPPLEADNGSISAVAQQLLPSTVQILAGEIDGDGATGSGFVLDRRGHVITNNHVVAEATDDGEIEIVDHEGRELDAEIVGRSPVYDIAVLQVDGARNLRPAALGSSQAMRVGESVVAIGSPLGLSSTVTSGIVSALDRPVTTGTDDESSYINAVQTDAAINPGNSGGPLVNLRGQVVGVNSAIATTGGAFGGDSGNIGVGFAIPMEQVRVTAAQILETGEAKYPVIGANVNTGEQQGGAEVVDVPSGTPAAAAGLQEGDVVVGVDDKQIDDGIELIVAIRSHQPGETIRLRVQRDGNEVEVDVTLDAKVG